MVMLLDFLRITLMAKKCGKEFGHMLSRQGGWYIENSLTTLNHKGR